MLIVWPSRTGPTLFRIKRNVDMVAVIDIPSRVPTELRCSYSFTSYSSARSLKLKLGKYPRIRAILAEWKGVSMTIPSSAWYVTQIEILPITHHAIESRWRANMKYYPDIECCLPWSLGPGDVKLIDSHDPKIYIQSYSKVSELTHIFAPIRYKNRLYHTIHRPATQLQGRLCDLGSS